MARVRLDEGWTLGIGILEYSRLSPLYSLEDNASCFVAVIVERESGWIGGASSIALPCCEIRLPIITIIQRSSINHM